MTDTATDVITELKDWLNDNWDPDLTVAQWWERLGLAGWSAPGLRCRARSSSTRAMPGDDCW